MPFETVFELFRYHHETSNGKDNFYYPYSCLGSLAYAPSFHRSIPSFRRVGRRDSWKQAFLGKDISHRVHS